MRQPRSSSARMLTHVIRAGSFSACGFWRGGLSIENSAAELDDKQISGPSAQPLRGGPSCVWVMDHRAPAALIAVIDFHLFMASRWKYHRVCTMYGCGNASAGSCTHLAIVLRLTLNSRARSDAGIQLCCSEQPTARAASARPPRGRGNVSNTVTFDSVQVNVGQKHRIGGITIGSA
jgi:hypothetical protein